LPGLGGESKMELEKSFAKAIESGDIKMVETILGEEPKISKLIEDKIIALAHLDFSGAGRILDLLRENIGIPRSLYLR
jgi:hypothetical protein